MRGRVRGVSGHDDVAIVDGWEIAAGDATSWAPAVVPGTAASALRAAGTWSLDGPARRFDAEDWSWRVRFSSPVAVAGEETHLCLDGLATLADVRLNGQPILESSDMFVAHRVPVTLERDNELVIRCRSLDAALAAKRPRPRWRAPMIESPQLRWFRTTLLGRTPGWSPPCAPVGPWRPVRIERARGVAVDEVTLRAKIDGANGVVDVRARLRDLGAMASAVLVVGEHRAVLDPEGRATLEIPDVRRWWPHTHGESALYDARVEVGAHVVDLGKVGFSTIDVDTHSGAFALRVNGARVFCRGACWTPLDVVTLRSSPSELRAALGQVRAAGMNMLRISGTMTYEDDAFYDAADALGILVWHDLMFANMDYPEDEAFVASCTHEVRQSLARLGGRPSIAVICGNSEGEQQAAMWGASRDRWSPALFHETLSAVSREVLPDVPYWPSSAHGGAFPHQANRGTTSYYGVGAYMRPLDDARGAEVRFATECLAFANIPTKTTLKVHQAAWKERVPRDLGAGWDFDDVRDHYLARLFRVDPATLRYADHERYLTLGRVVTGEVMAHVFGEWRRAESTCGGGLVWFLRDLWAGAGWGVVDAGGAPKAAYHYLKRALAPVALHVSDEGTNGLVVHVANDGPSLEGELAIALYRGDVPVGRGRAPVTVPARGALAVDALALFDGFLDIGYAYRFGPPACDLVIATLQAPDPIAEAFHFPLGLPNERRADLGLTATLGARPDGDLDLGIVTRSFAQSIAIDVAGHEPEDAFFHLAPGGTRTVRLRRVHDVPNVRGEISAMNAESATAVMVAK